MTCCAVRHVGSREYDSRLACPPKTCLTKKGRERESSVELAEDRGYPDGFNMQALSDVIQELSEMSRRKESKDRMSNANASLYALLPATFPCTF